MQADLHPIPRAVRQRKVVPRNGIRLHVDHLIELLQHPHSDIAALCQGELLADADAWSAVELLSVSLYPGLKREGEAYRHELPANLAVLPALRLEHFGVKAPDVFAVVQDVNAVVDGHSLGNKDF